MTTDQDNLIEEYLDSIHRVLDLQHVTIKEIVTTLADLAVVGKPLITSFLHVDALRPIASATLGWTEQIVLWSNANTNGNDKDVIKRAKTYARTLYNLVFALDAFMELDK